MRRLARILGNLLLVLGLGGLAVYSAPLLLDLAASPGKPPIALDLPTAGPTTPPEPLVSAPAADPTPSLAEAPEAPALAAVQPEPPAPTPSPPATSEAPQPSGAVATAPPRPTLAPPTATRPAPTPTPLPAPITRVVMPSIPLTAEVVVAPIRETPNGDTWDVPAFKAGHAELTADAGRRGNAVLLGHVSSLNAGNVFQRLDRANVGDLVQVFSDTTLFRYRVSEILTVDRTDVSVLEPTTSATISLITCTGAWNPVLHDYMQRLVVRAELVEPELPRHQ